MPRSAVKNRAQAIKPMPKKPRNASISLNRKENLIQPCTSKSSSRLNRCFRAKSRKDLTLKNKNAGAEKKTVINTTKTFTPHNVNLDVSSKLQTIREGTDTSKKDNDSIQLREICFIKNAEGKTVIAKYQNKDNANFDDKLVVSWNAASTKAQIFTQKARISSAPPYIRNKRYFSEPATSKQSVFRVHNFSKNASTNKMKKHPLRRPASASDTLKIDKAKKKKLKTK